MISTESIFFSAVLVFGLMLIGIVLTALEFKKMTGVTADERQSQKESANRHRARIVSASEEGVNQAERERLAEPDALHH